MMTTVKELSAKDFEQALQGDKPVLVDFWAPWCGPCRMQGPIVDALAQELGDAAVVAKVNTDENFDLADQYGVQGIPTLIVFKGGRPSKTFVGLTQAEALKAALA
jgi:thioredoxin 1